MSTQRRHMSFRLERVVADQLAERARERGEKITPLAARYVSGWWEMFLGDSPEWNGPL